MAFRWFLDFGLHDTIPNHTSDTHFRQRIGAERFERIFQELLTQAREHGLVRDRLRLKDATHLLADAANLQPLALAAQLRDHLLRAAQCFWPDWVAEQQANSETLRQTSAEWPDDERLAARIEQVRSLVSHLNEQIATWSPDADTKAHERLRRLLAIAGKFLDDRDPDAHDRLASVTDPDARVGKHGAYFVGYLLDVALDPDSELITAVNVLPGNGPEAIDTITLIEQEEQAQGNDVAEVSLDGAGFHGPLLRELSDPAGLNVVVTVPPPQQPERHTFAPERFTLSMVDGRGEVTCPAGQTTRQRERVKDKHASRYTFKPSQCRDCPLRSQCLNHLHGSKGRTVMKNDYDAEYQQVRARAQTAAYAETRRRHPQVERKLGELVRHHDGRRARYRGLLATRVQAFVTALVVNVKRLVKLLMVEKDGGAGTLRVRAGVATA
jgi:IS5 family transposase